MPNPFDALISGSESDGDGGAKNKPIATKKPANPAVEAAKARNTSQAPSKPVQTARVAEPQKATAKPTAVRTPKVYANAPPATELAMDEKDLKTRDHITDSRPHQHTRAGERGRGGAGRGVPRGRGAGFAPRGGKREFDRRSGSGHIRNELKREGRGAHNWGGATDNAEVDKVLAEVQKNNNNVSGETLVPTKPDTKTAEEEEDHGGVTVETKPKPEGEGGEVETEVKAEPEKPTLSLEEYLAQKNEKRRGAAFKELGEVEVEDVSEGRAYAKKDAVVADTEDAYFSVQTSGGKTNKKPTSGAAAAVKENKEEKDKKKAAAVVVETGFFVKKETSESSGGNRGGRGGGGFRGGGNRGRGGAAAGERGGFRGERDGGGGGGVGENRTGGGNFERRRPPPQQTQGYGGRGGNSRHHESGTATGSRAAAAAATAVVVDTTNISAFPELSAA